MITQDLGIATAYGYAKSKGYTGTEEEFAELMASYATVAEEAEESAEAAEAAKDAAVSAKNDAVSAKNAAQTAQASAETASGTATTKAGEASTSAQNAASSASSASASATAASGHASTAQTAAGTATTKAQEASASATAAGTAKTGAETAQTAAEIAQASAEDAAEAAEASATSISESAGQIETNKDDIAELKNDFKQLEAKVEDAYNAYVTETETGSIASFSDGADDVPAKDLTVAIEPVQDLHGQSSPYPAGGGKNLLSCSITASTVSGITFSINTDPAGNILSISANGTATDTILTAIGAFEASDNSQYILNGCPSGGGSETYRLDARNPSVVGVDTGEGSSAFSASGTCTIYLRIASGVTLSNKLFYPMVRLSSVSDATYAPYSNECPISGWTGANVINAERLVVLRPDAPQTYTERGVAWDASRYPFITAKGTASGGTSYSGLIGGRAQDNSLTAGTYALKAVGNIDNAKIVIQLGSATAQNIDKNTPEITVTVNDTTTLAWYCIVDNDITVDASFAFVIGSSEYVSVDWTTEAGTVYGGTLDVTTGVLTVTHKLIQVDGVNLKVEGIYGNGTAYSGSIPDIYNDSSYARQNEVLITSDKLKGSTFVNIASAQYGVSQSGGMRAIFNIPNCSTVSDFNTWLQANTPQLLCELAQPQTYQLTLHEVSTILGQNNIFADCGDSTVQYRADTKLYIDKVMSA